MCSAASPPVEIRPATCSPAFVSAPRRRAGGGATPALIQAQFRPHPRTPPRWREFRWTSSCHLPCERINQHSTLLAALAARQVAVPVIGHTYSPAAKGKNARPMSVACARKVGQTSFAVPGRFVRICWRGLSSHRPSSALSLQPKGRSLLYSNLTVVAHRPGQTRTYGACQRPAQSE